VEEVRSALLGRENAGILFTGTRRSAENYARLFEKERITLLPYHAGMSDEERRAIEGALEREKESGRSPSISATNAFGMGMDFPQLRWALLSQAPFSLLSLVQAFGRVGRAGTAGLAEIIWCEEDFRIAGYLVASSKNRVAAERRLADLRKYLESTPSERTTLLCEAFL
jgi:ATP-dependent DNA helicase RecQ